MTGCRCAFDTPAIPPQVDLIISPDLMLTPGMELAGGQSVAIKDGAIVAVGRSADIAASYRARDTMRADGKLLLPGLVDGHTHTAQQLLRGRTFNERPMIWTRILVPFESNLDPPDVYDSAMLASIEMIRSGITCFADAGGPHAEQVAEAAIRSGLRAVITRSTMDIGDSIPESMRETAESAVARNDELFLSHDGSGNGRVRIWFGLRQMMTSSPELMRRVAEKSRQRNTGVHIHLAEHRNEIDHCMTRYGVRPPELLEQMGLLDDHLLAAHSVLLSDREVKTLSEHGVHPVHCARANLQSHGFPKAALFATFGHQVAMGTDGASGGTLDLFAGLRTLYLANRAYYGMPVHDASSLTAGYLMAALTIGGAKAVRQENSIGSIQAGKKADVILIDLTRPHLMPMSESVDAVVSYVQPSDVTDVVVDGRVLMRNSEILHLDQTEIARKAGEARRNVYRRAGL